ASYSAAVDVVGISGHSSRINRIPVIIAGTKCDAGHLLRRIVCRRGNGIRSEEHTSELQSRFDLVCRLLLEKKKHITQISPATSTQSTRLRYVHFFFIILRLHPPSTLFPYTTLFRSASYSAAVDVVGISGHSSRINRIPVIIAGTKCDAGHLLRRIVCRRGNGI